MYGACAHTFTCYTCHSKQSVRVHSTWVVDMWMVWWCRHQPCFGLPLTSRPCFSLWLDRVSWHINHIMNYSRKAPRIWTILCIVWGTMRALCVHYACTMRAFQPKCVTCIVLYLLCIYCAIFIPPAPAHFLGCPRSRPHATEKTAVQRRRGHPEFENYFVFFGAPCVHYACIR